MLISKDKWTAAYKRAVVDMKAQNTPTAGIVCAVATMRLVRDQMLDAVGEEDKAGVRDAFAELLHQIQERNADGKYVYELAGFASNASAAAKAAGYANAQSRLSEAD